MRYKPIESRNDALDRIAGLGYDEFSIVSYEENWQREQGEPDIEITRNAEHAVDRFLTLCGRAVCVELRGIQPGGSETALCIGGTAPDLSEKGEYIEWSKPEQEQNSQLQANGRWRNDAAPEAASGGFCRRPGRGGDAFVQKLEDRAQEIRYLRLQLAQARADSPKPRPRESELPPLFSAVLEKTDAQLRQEARFHVQRSEDGMSWETVTEHCCLGGCDLGVYTFPTERDALLFAALLQAAGYRPPHNIACPACYAEYQKDCI